ncbi:MAG: FAD-dependent oxidoreductase [Streptosporangiaceae bacterium]
MVSERFVVVGAGVMGAAVADALAAAGAHVTLLDRDQPGRGTSRWSLAWLNSNDKAPRAYHDLNAAGIGAWAELAPDLHGDAWYRPVGHLELAASGAALEARVRRLTEWGYPARIISPAEAAELEPALHPAALHPAAISTATAFFPAEGYVLTEPLIQRLVARAHQHGAALATGEAGHVTSIDTAPGQPPQVRTADGQVHPADQVICCAGRWTPTLADPVPLVPWDAPGSAAPGLVVRVGPVAPEHAPVRLLHTPELSLRPHAGGLVHLEAEDATAAVDLHTPEPELRRWAGELLTRARRTVRGLDDAAVVDFQVCARPLPPDGQSIVGPVPGADGLYVAVTHSGVTLAAQLARLITADLTSSGPVAALAPYRPSRFTTLPGRRD